MAKNKIVDADCLSATAEIFGWFTLSGVGRLLLLSANTNEKCALRMATTLQV